MAALKPQTEAKRTNACVRQTPARLEAIFKQLNADDFAAKCGYGQKTKAQQEIMAKLALDKEIFPEGLPNVQTVFKWVDEVVAKRKADVGANVDKDHSGGGDESEEDAEAAGREYVSFNENLDSEIDDYLMRMNEIEKEKHMSELEKQAAEERGEVCACFVCCG